MKGLTIQVDGNQIAGLPYNQERRYLLEWITAARQCLRFAVQSARSSENPAFWWDAIEYYRGILRWATNELIRIKRELRQVYG